MLTPCHSRSWDTSASHTRPPRYRTRRRSGCPDPRVALPVTRPCTRRPRAGA